MLRATNPPYVRVFTPLPQGATNQSIPIVLAVSAADKARAEGSPCLALRYQGRVRAIVRNPEFYPHRREERAARQFGTTNPNHPYIKVITNPNNPYIKVTICSNRTR